VSFAAITVCVASQRVFIVVVYFVIDLFPKLLNFSSYSAFTDRVFSNFWTQLNMIQPF
jgi:hypothetical protein